VRSVALSVACGVVRGLAFGRERGEPSPRIRVKGDGSGEEPGSAAAKDSPAYGAPLRGRPGVSGPVRSVLCACALPGGQG